VSDFFDKIFFRQESFSSEILFPEGFFDEKIFDRKTFDEKNRCPKKFNEPIIKTIIYSSIIFNESEKCF